MEPQKYPSYILFDIYRPRSRGDNTFGSVRPSVRLSVRLSVCPSADLTPYTFTITSPRYFPLHPGNSKDRSPYWQKSAYLNGQISLNSMTHPLCSCFNPSYGFKKKNHTDPKNCIIWYKPENN